MLMMVLGADVVSGIIADGRMGSHGSHACYQFVPGLIWLAREEGERDPNGRDSLAETLAWISPWAVVECHLDQTTSEDIIRLTNPSRSDGGLGFACEGNIRAWASFS
jgi:hypothetical protein